MKYFVLPKSVSTNDWFNTKRPLRSHKAVAARSMGSSEIEACCGAKNCCTIIYRVQIHFRLGFKMSHKKGEWGSSAVITNLSCLHQSATLPNEHVQCYISKFTPSPRENRMSIASTFGCPQRAEFNLEELCLHYSIRFISGNASALKTQAHINYS